MGGQRSPQTADHTFQGQPQGMVTDPDGKAQGRPLGKAGGLVMGGQQCAGMVQKHRPICRGTDKAGRALQQLAAKLHLQRLETLADRRLYRPRRLGCAGQASQVDGQNEEADGFQIKHHHGLL